MAYAAIALCGYLIGALPFGWLLARGVRGIEIREHGSGNIGATNVLRVMGVPWGVLCLLLDALKGAGPVLLTPALAGALGAPDAAAAGRLVAAVAAILGHVFPVYLGLKGGKGVATSLGALLALRPIPTLIAVGGFAVVVGATRVVSLGSVVAAVVLAVAVIVLEPDPMGGIGLAYAITVVFVAGLVIWRHRGNLARLRKGLEARLGASPPQGE